VFINKLNKKDVIKMPKQTPRSDAFAKTPRKTRNGQQIGLKNPCRACLF
jgi:hypothetical protein